MIFNCKFLLITYITFIFLSAQYVFLDNSILKSIYNNFRIFLDNKLCSPVHNQEYHYVLQGRLDSVYPSPRCCTGKSCIKRNKKRNIILTTLRSDNYLPLLKNLVCSLKNSNPNVNLVVATVEGDLSQSTMIALNSMDVDIIFWEDIKFPNKKSARFSLNWVKIRAWEMEVYDAILMVDVDTVILDDVSHLFALPAAFATALDQDKTDMRYSSLGRMQGGVVLLRPCAAVARHMISLLESQTSLRFTTGHAEQSFFDW